MKHPWQYVREAWHKTESLVDDRDVLRVWINTIKRAMADAKIPDDWDTLCHECGWHGVHEFDVSNDTCPDCGSTQLWERMEPETCQDDCNEEEAQKT